MARLREREQWRHAVAADVSSPQEAQRLVTLAVEHFGGQQRIDLIRDQIAKGVSPQEFALFLAVAIPVLTVALYAPAGAQPATA